MKAFSFAQTAIDTASLRAALADPACGGYASFEGWVRDHNEGQAVTHLEYEAFEPLAVSEGERIVAEAIAKFGIRRAACVHRVGDLGLGELAVWVGVSSAHRGEAFAACRYIIDEVKHRVPIWKKEHYANGDSGWVNCERCAAHGVTANDGHQHDHTHAAQTPRMDYSRQTALPEIGLEGQAKLAAARVLVIGAGGLGVHVLTSLAGAGVGTIGIVDGDALEASNLHRQTLYALSDVGRPKAELAAERLKALNPEIAVHAFVERAEPGNLPIRLQTYDLVVECSDNFTTKFLVNDAAVLAGRPAIFASVHQYEGQLQVYDPARDGACLRCLWPEGTRDGLVGNCALAGVLGPVPATLGQMQALEALKLILGLPGSLCGELLLVDLLGMRVERVRAPRCADCRTGSCVRIRSLRGSRDPQAETVDVALDDLSMAMARGYTLVDVREHVESHADPIIEAACLTIPAGRLLEEAARLDPQAYYLLVCARGVRSRATALELRARGVARVFSLRGGLAGVRSRLPA